MFLNRNLIYSAQNRLANGSENSQPQLPPEKAVNSHFWELFFSVEVDNNVRTWTEHEASRSGTLMEHQIRIY